jgi:hypothetical protein
MTAELIDQVRTRLASIEVLEPTTSGRLHAFGLRWSPPLGEEYLTLDEALTSSRLSITEVNEGGDVPTLLAVNEGDSRVLLVAGEHLVGAKQDRVLNVSLMVPPHTRQRVPVSCVESGRWRYRSRRSRSSGSSSHARLRRKMSGHMHRSFAFCGWPSSDQSEVWREVSDKLDKLCSVSPSQALDAGYKDRAQELDRIHESLRLPEGCSGVVWAIGSEIAGGDLFDRASTFEKLYPKLLRSYAIDAIEEAETPETEVPGTDRVRSWLREVTDARFEAFDSPGLGHDVRVASPTHQGAVLVVEEPVHTELFPADAAPEYRYRGRLVLLPTTTGQLTAIEAVLPLLEGALHLDVQVLHELLREEPASADEEERHLDDVLRSWEGDQLRLVFTERLPPDGRRLRWDATTGTAVACVRTGTVEPTSALLGSLILTVGALAHPVLRDRELLHRDTRGCLFDLHDPAPRFSICPSCQGALVPTELGHRLPAALRHLQLE